MYRSKASIFILLAAVSLRAEQARVELRNNEIWLIQNGVSKQLTNDGADKIGLTLSHSASKVAYIKQCVQGGSNCSATLVIIDLAGGSKSSFEPQLSAAGGPCLSLVSMSWTSDDKAIASECHINPSLSEYVETDLSTGKTRRDLLGYEFMPSPDGLKVAHVGPYPHFSWPVAKSNFLMVDEVIIYPLPKGSKPIVSKDFETPEGIVRRVGSKYSGIHEFASSFTWQLIPGRLPLLTASSTGFRKHRISKWATKRIGAARWRLCQQAETSLCFHSVAKRPSQPMIQASGGSRATRCKSRLPALKYSRFLNGCCISEMTKIIVTAKE